MRTTIVLGLVLFVLGAPAPGAADSHVEAEVRAAVERSYSAIAEDLVDDRAGISGQGALQFWSSGGLMLESLPEDPSIEYDAFNVGPKHVEVIVLSDKAAVALYYAEGSMKPKGREAVARYLTRVMEVYVKENGVWKARAGHWSPLIGGGGTSRVTD